MASLTELSAGQYGKAAQYAAQAVSVEPSNASLHAHLGYLYYKNPQYDRAAAELSLFVRGGKTADGIVVKGVPLAIGKPADYYSIYSLALSNAAQCNDAVQVAQLVLQNISEEEAAYFNAQTAIDNCQQGAQSASQQAEATTAP